MKRGYVFALILSLIVAAHVESAPVSTVDLLDQWRNGSYPRDNDIKAEILSRPDLIVALQHLASQGRLDQTHIWLLRDVPFELSAQFLGQVMQSTDPYIHGAACSVLEKLGDCRGVAMLEDSLIKYRNIPPPKDKTGRAQRPKELIDITQALGKISCPESTRVLTTLLDHDSPVVTCFAAEGLAARGEKSAVPVLITLLDKSVDVTGSMCGMGQIPVKTVAARALQHATFECFVDPDQYGRGAKEAWLSADLRPFDWLSVGDDERRDSKRDDRHLQHLWEQWWKQHDESTRTEWRDEAFTWASHAVENKDDRPRAFYRMAIIGDQQAVLFLENFLRRKDMEEEDLAQALQAFVSLHYDSRMMNARPRAASLENLFFDTLVNHPMPAVRAAAARGLRYYPTDAACAALCESLDNATVAPAALHSLGYFKDHPVPPELLTPFIDHTNASTRGTVVEQLNKSQFAGKERLYLDRLEVEKQAGVKADLLEGLVECGTRDSVPLLLTLLKDSNSAVRRETVDALEAIAGQDFDYRKWESKPDLEGQARIEAWWANQQ